MNFTVRKGKVEDVETVLQLIIELAIFENEPNAVEITIEDLKKDGFGKVPKFNFFVAQEDQEIIGLAFFYERYSTWKGRVLHLEDLIVTKSKRKSGVGKALYAEVLKYAYKNDYNRVAWEVLDWNRNAIQFYENSGAKVLKEWNVAQMDKENLATFVKNN